MSTKAADTRQDARRFPCSISSHAAMRLTALILVFACLYFARALFLPLVLALILTLTLTPIIKWGQRLKIPAALVAGFLIFSIGATSVALVITLAAPVADMVSRAPALGSDLKRKLKILRAPVESINKVGEEVEKIADTADDSGVGYTQEVVIKQRGLVTRAADDVITFIATAILTLTLSFFLLITRDLFYLKVVRVLPSLTERKNALAVARRVEADVSGYLLTVAFINSCLGAAVGAAMWVLDVPNPLLWGLMAAVLNFMPYVGAIIGILIVATVSFLTFDTWFAIAMPPASYLLLTFVEGQFLTPLALSKRFALNTVVIIMAIALWGFMWGSVGVIVAVPLLIILKAFCDQIESLSNIAEFLSGEDAPASVVDSSSDTAEPRSRLEHAPPLR